MNLARPPIESALDELGIPKLVGALRNLRAASQMRRYRGAAPDLPSREEAVDIADGLTAALYPRHFGPSGLRSDSADAFVANQLTESLLALRRQVQLELRLAGERDGATQSVARHADDILAAFAARLPNVREMLDGDIRAAFDGDPSAKSIDEIVFCFPGVLALIQHRIAHELYRLGAPLLARIVAESAHSRTGIDIHPGAEIGEGFFIDHGTGVVIGETTIIGRNVRLYQAVTLGAKRFEKGSDGALLKNYPRHPIIEDNVVIYAGATVLGRVTIGRGSSIGGNVWLTHSVPPGSNVTQATAREESFHQGAGI